MDKTNNGQDKPRKRKILDKTNPGHDKMMTMEKKNLKHGGDP
jgi:hypothetical protein